jgi:hypothetical protein
LYARKVPSPQIVSVLQGPGYQKVLGTGVSALPEDQKARKAPLTPKRILAVWKMKWVPLSQPRGEEPLVWRMWFQMGLSSALRSE